MTRDSSLPQLVHFFGPDGSGKSVQARILTTFLVKKEEKVKKYWLRAHHTFAFVLWKMLVRIGFFRVIINEHGVTTKLPAVNLTKFLQGLWSAVEFASVLPIILRADLLVLRGYHIIAERYILDTITGIAYVIDDIAFLRSRTVKILLALIPQKTFFVFLDSDYKTIDQRRAGAMIEPRAFIEFQRKAYAILAQYVGALTIDTSKNGIEETSKEILSCLGLS